MRRLFGCPDIVSLTEKFLMARNFFRIFTENNPVMWDSKTFCIPEAKGLREQYALSFCNVSADDKRVNPIEDNHIFYVIK